ncbi:MAG: hypothetical protein ACP5IE_10570 [Infirmifilum sp.]
MSNQLIQGTWMKISGTWDEKGMAEIERVNSYLERCKNIDGLSIPLEDWGFNYELGLYRCQKGFVYFYETDDEKGFAIKLGVFPTLDEVRRAWDEDIESIANEIRDLAKNYSNEGVRMELMGLVNEIRGHKWFA